MQGFLILFLLAKVSRYCKKHNLFPQYLIVSEFVCNVSQRMQSLAKMSHVGISVHPWSPFN